MTLFNELPQAAQDKIKSRLRAYDSVTVTREANGDYVVMAATIIHNSAYNEYIGEYYAKDVFTIDERIVNYVNAFRSFPRGYHGKKDWLTMNSDWTSATLKDGNIVFS